MKNLVDFVNPADLDLHSFQTRMCMIHFRCLLITFANILDPDQAPQNPDLDPKCLTLWYDIPESFLLLKKLIWK